MCVRLRGFVETTVVRSRSGVRVRVLVRVWGEIFVE
jgi:hypothetical protein